MSQLTADQLAEIDAARAHTQPTARATAPGLEAVLYQPVCVLDQGFVRVVDYMGDDDAVVQGARVSYGRGTRQVSSDRGLIRYLMRHRHTTPFELCDLKLHVRAPIFVARQWFRHRTASINEYSGRYSVLEREFYTPDPAQVATQSATNRQGRGDPADPETARHVIETLRHEAARSYDAYLDMLNQDEDGTPRDPTREGLTRELARTTLPVSIYTQFYWKVNLWNLLHFLDLRADAHAQYEIRVYAEAILDLVKLWVPTTHEAFLDYVRNAAPLSAQQLALVRAALKTTTPLDPTTHGLSPRETRDLVDLVPELAGRLSEASK